MQQNIQLIKADHEHVAGDIFYTEEGEKEPNCTESGIVGSVKIKKK